MTLLSAPQPRPGERGCEIIDITAEMLKSSKKGLKCPGDSPLPSCSVHGGVKHVLGPTCEHAI